MKKLLEHIWCDNIYPLEKQINEDSEVKFLSELTDANSNDLIKTLSEEQKKLFLRYEESVGRMNSEIEKVTFIYAFRRGAMLAIEILTEKDW